MASAKSVAASAVNVQRVDYINIGLMVIACILAFNLPFELFLFSYAVLGPLHYITEISWLHEKNYFTVSRNDYWVFIILCLIMLIMYMIPEMSQWSVTKPIFDSIGQESVQRFLQKADDGKWFAHIVFISFASAVVFVLIKNKWVRAVLISLSLLLGIALRQSDVYDVVFSALLTTMIHVWFFTGVFILAGALKSNKASGFISLGVFLLCSVMFLFFTPVQSAQYQANSYVMQTFEKSTFAGLSYTLFNLFKGSSQESFTLLSVIGLKIQGFIAFAYTYHYLNWFSKTSVIKWHKVPKKWLAGSAAVWLASVGLYFYDYHVGLQALFFLSMLHVFLEFPLNYRTIFTVTSDIAGRITGKKAAPSKAR